MKGLRGIIFDCDGVLFESRRANLAFYNTILDAMGEEQVAETDQVRMLLCHTAASPQVFAELLGPVRAEQALALAQEVDYRQFIPWMDPEPGMNDALACLSQHYPLAVATNRGFSMPQILEHFSLSGYFRTVVTSRDVERPKPSPDMLFEAASRLGFAPGELLFVGDSVLDQAAARAAGMPFANYRGDLAAELKIDHHRQLVELLVGDRKLDV